METEEGCCFCFGNIKITLPVSQSPHVESEGTKHRSGAYGQLKTAPGKVHFQGEFTI